MVSVKCVVVGSGFSAKTELLHAYISRQSSADSVLTDDCISSVTISKSPITMGLFNTAGQEDYDRLRPLSYPQTDVFLLCFSVVSPSSYNELKDRFVPEIKGHCPNVPIILVGTESHLRNDPKRLKDLYLSGESPVGRKEVNDLANEIEAVKYIECSTFTRKGVDMVFEEAAIAALDYLESKDMKRCSIN